MRGWEQRAVTAHPRRQHPTTLAAGGWPWHPLLLGNKVSPGKG